MTDAVSRPPLSLKTLIGPGILAVRRFWKPFILLQAAAFALVLAYYGSGNVRQICLHLSEFKQRSGLVFAAISAAIAGAFLPEIAKAVMLGDRVVDRKRVNNIIFALLGFAGNGIIVDLQYRGLAWLFGNDAHTITIAKKLVMDQFVCTPLYSIPYWMLLYLWRTNRYSLRAMVRGITVSWYVSRMFPLLIPAWCFWIPMVILIYALPGPLQYWLFCFDLAGWSLIMIFVASQEQLEDPAGQVMPATVAVSATPAA